jgi:hypothetical protein
LVAKLFLIEIVLFQEFGPEILRRHGNVWPPFRSKVHEIPIRPNRIEMIPRQFSPPEMKNLSFPPPKDMHHRQLPVIGVSLAFVIGLIGICAETLWDGDTVMEYQTGNGQAARGGSLDGPGTVIVCGMVCVSSAYRQFGGMTFP